MASGTKIRRKSETREEDSYRSDDESGTRSRASVKKKKKKSSEVSTAASTSSSARKKAKKKKAAKEANNVMSDLAGAADPPSRSKGEKKRKVPKKIKRKKDFGDEHSEIDDGISCLTDNSDLKKGKNKKKRSPSKKTRRSKSANDGNVSDGTETSSSKKNKRNNLSKLNRRDKLYHQNSEINSVASPYYTHSYDESDDENQKKTRPSSRHSRTSSKSSSRHSRTSSRSPSRHSRTSAVSSSRRKKKTKKIGRDGSTKPSVPKRSPSLDRHYDNCSSDFDDVSISDSDEEKPPSSRPTSPRGKVKKRPDMSRMNSLDQVRLMGIVSKNKRGVVNDSNHTTTPTVSTTSRRNPQPERIAARGNSVQVRSHSADHLSEMRMNLVRNPSNISVQKNRNAGNVNGYSNTGGRLYCAPSPRDAPVRRGVGRNSSAPLRPAKRSPSQSLVTRRGPGGGPHQQRGPLRSAQRRPPPRSNSRELSTTEHVEMLEGLRTGGFLDRGASSSNNDNYYPKQRSSSQPPGGLFGGSRHNRPERRTSRTKAVNRSLSPSRDAHSHRKTFREHAYPSKGDIIESSDIDSSDLDEGSVEIQFESVEHNEELNDSRHMFGNNGRTITRTRSRSSRPGLKRSNSNDSFLKGLSAHSFMSNRSQMSIDSKEGFDDDPNWKAALRYVRLLPPHKGETKLKMKIRLFTWTSIMLDFIAAMVAAIQYDGSTLCCKEPIFNALIKMNWDVLFRVVTTLYLVLIFAELIPVIRNGIPFNIVNPTIGFIITFGMFFDDSVFEAVAMWVIEVLAIFFEFLVYRVNARIYFETTFKLKQVDEELETLKNKRKQIVEMVQGMNGGSAHSFGGSAHGLRDGYFSRDTSRNYQINDLEMGGRILPAIERSPYDDDDNDSFSGHSFGEDEDFYDEKTPSGRSLGNSSPAKSTPPPLRRMRSKQGSSKFSEHSSRTPHRIGLNRTMSRGSLGASSVHSFEANTITTGPGGRIRLPGEIKQNRLLRRRRILRENKKAESTDLHYHFIGTVLNVSIATMAMILVVTIASTGGLCFRDNSVSIFSFDQLGRCDRCSDRTQYCEVCSDGEGNQCYFPYY